MKTNFSEDIDASEDAQSTYLEALAAIDLRDEWDSDDDDESGTEDDSTTSKSPAAGPSSSCRPSKKARTNKHKTSKPPRNRAPFIKNEPPKPGDPGCETFVPEYFTMGELEDQFSATWEYVFDHRMTWYARHVEDYVQKLM